MLVGIGVHAAAPGTIWYFFVRALPAPVAGAAATTPSIAVLPLVNLSSDKEQEYFSDGIAEEILNARNDDAPGHRLRRGQPGALVTARGGKTVPVLCPPETEKTMAYSLACADSGANCPGKFVTATEKELMDHVKIHMQASHPEMMKSPPPPEALKKLIKQV